MADCHGGIVTEIILTDLTRFKPGSLDVCTAGADTQSGACIRPMPYIASAEVRRLKLLPGSILSGTFTAPSTPVVSPHTEDRAWSNLSLSGAATSAQFKWALEQGLFSSVEHGFEVQLPPNTKQIDPQRVGPRSIITLRVDPTAVRLERDAYKTDGIRVHFRDSSGKDYRYLSLTDLGFHMHAARLLGLGRLQELNDFMHRQDEVYLRVGLARPWARHAGDPKTCWIQVNGIYTFPDFDRSIRSHS